MEGRLISPTRKLKSRIKWIRYNIDEIQKVMRGMDSHLDRAISLSRIQLEVVEGNLIRVLNNLNKGEKEK